MCSFKLYNFSGDTVSGAFCCDRNHLPEVIEGFRRYQTLDVIALATARAGDAEIAEIDVTHLVEFFASSQRVTVSREGTVRVEAGSGTTDFRVGVAPRLSGSDLQVQPLQATVSEDEVRARDLAIPHVPWTIGSPIAQCDTSMSSLIMCV